MSRNDCCLSKRRITNGVGKKQHVGRSFELQLKRLTKDISSYHNDRYDKEDLLLVGLHPRYLMMMQLLREESGPIGRLPFPGRE